MEQIQDCDIKDFIRSRHPYTFSLALVCFVRVLAATGFDRRDGPKAFSEKKKGKKEKDPVG